MIMFSFLWRVLYTYFPNSSHAFKCFASIFKHTHILKFYMVLSPNHFPFGFCGIFLMRPSLCWKLLHFSKLVTLSCVKGRLFKGKSWPFPLEHNVTFGLKNSIPWHHFFSNITLLWKMLNIHRGRTDSIMQSHLFVSQLQ